MLQETRVAPSALKNESDFAIDFSLESLQFNEENENESDVHPFQHRLDFLSFKGYKAKINQEKRRAEFINRQKQARLKFTEFFRHQTLENSVDVAHVSTAEIQTNQQNSTNSVVAQDSSPNNSFLQKETTRAINTNCNKYLLNEDEMSAISIPPRKKKINLVNFMTKPPPRDSDVNIIDTIQKMKENIINNFHSTQQESNSDIQKTVSEKTKNDKSPKKKWDDTKHNVKSIKVNLESKKYKNKLMMPEFLAEIPADFHTNWYCVPYPAGRRCLLVASKGRTLLVRRDGTEIIRFPSRLPGGSLATHGRTGTLCLLDVILHEASWTIYVIDLMTWNSLSALEWEASLRLFFRISRLLEIDGIDEVDVARNYYKIKNLFAYECSLEGLQKAVHEPLPFEREGILFYHKEGLYHFGVTPLMGIIDIKLGDLLIRKCAKQHTVQSDDNSTNTTDKEAKIPWYQTENFVSS
jgi:hypothetical protein